MSRAKKNRSTTQKFDGRFTVDEDVKLSPEALEAGLDEILGWRWRTRADLKNQDPNDPPFKIRVIEWDDPNVPDVIECGRLARLHIRVTRAVKGKKVHPRRDTEAMIEFSRMVAGGSHIAFDPVHSDQRLYLLINDKALPVLRERLWDANSARPMDLNDVALIAGGRHGRRRDYPEIMVKPVGLLTAVVYFANKKTNGPSYYIHAVGEISHHYPILCVDAEGKLWLAGGNYTSPTEGITD